MAGKIKFFGWILVAVLIIVGTQWYAKSRFAKYSGIDLPFMSFAVKWSSDQTDFFAAYLTTPANARSLIRDTSAGKEWRNDTLNVKLSPTHRNIPFFDLNGYELINPNKNRWFFVKIRKLDPNKHLYRGHAVIIYPDEGLIYISVGK